MLRALSCLGIASLVAACSSGSPSPAPQHSGSSKGSDTSGSGTPPVVTGWNAVVGGGGLFAQSFDARSWRDLPAGTVENLYSVTCASEAIGWVAGSGGFIGHTVDSGKTWAPETTNTRADLYGVRFGTATDGVAVGAGGTVLVTHDGGETWTSHPGLTSLSLRSVAFGWDGNLVVAVGDAGIVLRSTNAGDTWSKMTLDSSAALLGVASDNAGELVLAVDDLGRVWKSNEGGWTFNLDTTAPAPLTSVSMSYDGSLALVAGAHGTALLRGAKGAWSTVNVPQGTNLHAALVVSSSRLFVAGDSGALFTSTDNGASWTAEAVQTSATLYGLDDF